MSRGPRKSKEVRAAEAQAHELYAMKRSEAEPRHYVHCSICGQRKSWGQFEMGNPPVCCDCYVLKKGGPKPDLLGQGKELGGKERVAQLALFEL